MKYFLILGCIGLVGLVSFQLIGSTIDNEGFLNEPFALLPISQLLTVIGFGGALVGRLFKGTAVGPCN